MSKVFNPPPHPQRPFVGPPPPWNNLGDPPTHPRMRVNSALGQVGPSQPLPI